MTPQLKVGDKFIRLHLGKPDSDYIYEIETELKTCFRTKNGKRVKIWQESIVMIGDSLYRGGGYFGYTYKKIE